MKYYKDLQTGAVTTEKPEGHLYREATAREYDAYKARLARLAGALERAVAYKARLLRV